MQGKRHTFGVKGRKKYPSGYFFLPYNPNVKFGIPHFAGRAASIFAIRRRPNAAM